MVKGDREEKIFFNWEFTVVRQRECVPSEQLFN